MRDWINAPDDIEPYIGFCYCVKELDTGMLYIGIKRFWMKVTRPPLKGKKNKRRSIKESNWKEYTTSSKIMQEKLKRNPNNYQRIILHCCKTVTELRAREAYIQLSYYFNNDWHRLYNQVINLRLRIPKIKR